MDKKVLKDYRVSKYHQNLIRSDGRLTIALTSQYSV
ncbi:Trichohyalin [Giardia duodenalis assemblage B]|uniref:Trichohyalin n=1 Tax=Giardia duodenalis assemblage B TaxID=1394984 RepID=A0A132NMG3_GIAIN|nr:Trichohyalin [Giardia intestinalis assemblage B]